MWLTDGFLLTLFGKVEGTVRTHVNSRVAHVWLPYTVIRSNVWGGGIANIGKLGKFRKLQFSSYIGSHEW